MLDKTNNPLLLLSQYYIYDLLEPLKSCDLPQLQINLLIFYDHNDIISLKSLVKELIQVAKFKYLYDKKQLKLLKQMIKNLFLILENKKAK